MTDKIDWFEMWFTDKNAMLETMLRNMNSDLNAGYDYFGENITKQRQMIEDYQKEFDWNMKEFRYMKEKDVQRWCYYDMKRRGVID